MAGSEDIIRKFKWFNCVEGTHYNDSTFNSNSFIRSGEQNVLFGGLRNESCNAQKDVILFDQVFDEGSAIYHINLLFRMARKEFKILEYSLQQLVNEEGDNPSIEDLSEEDYQQLRKHNCEFLNYIRIYFLSLPLEMKYLSDRVKVDLLSELSLFYRSLPQMSSYADFYVHQSSKKTSNGLYHMFHLNLDVRWYYVSLLVILKNYADSISDMSGESEAGLVLESRRVKEAGLVEKQVQVLLSELLSIALARFEKINTSDLYEETPFICTCVKELWLLLQILCDSLSDSRSGKSFWIQVNVLLEKVVPMSSAARDESDSEKTPTMETFHCSDPTAFSLWMLLHLSYLYGYNHNGEFLGRKSGRARNNFSHLEKFLLTFINQNSQTGNEHQMECQMRQYIYMASQVCLERWWEPMRVEPIMIFWEYYHRRLSASLLLPGASPAMLPILSKSAVGILVQVKERLSDHKKTGYEEDSFCVFLKFLGLYLMRCNKEENSSEGSGLRQWQQMRGRIYSKLGSAKVKGLSQMGFYRLISLFLTLSITADIKEVGKKLLDVLALLHPWDPKGRDMSKRELAWQAHLCVLCLHVEHEIDIAQAAEPLLEEVQVVCNELASISKSNSNSMFSESWKIETNNSEGLRRLLLLFTEGMNEIIDSSPKLSLSEYTLIGPWLPHWLKLCSSSAARKLMDAILAIVEKLRTLRRCIFQRSDHLSDSWGETNDAEMIDDGEEAKLMKEQWNKMEAVLVENVLPSVRSHCLGTNPPFQVADLAVAFTLSAYSGSGENFTQLFTYFAASDAVNYRISRRYLCHLLPNEKFMEALSAQLSDYQDVIIQAWVRSSMLSYEESGIGELEELTRVVVKLKKISRLLSSPISSSNSSLSSIDSFEQLLKVVGEKYDTFQTVFERSKFREACSVFFTKVDKIIGPHVRTPSSPEIMMSIYHCCGLMVLHCGNLIYTKGKPNCLLPFIISQLILPPFIYNPDTKLHKYILAAVKRSIDMYACGLARLSPASDPYIKRCLRDTVMQYLPCLYEKHQSFPSLPHPLLGSFEENNNQNETLQNAVLDILTTVFLTFREKQPHPHASKAIGLLQQIVEITRRKSKGEIQGKDLVRLVATRSLPGLFDFLLGVNEKSEEWKMALNLINSIVSALKEMSSSEGSINQSDELFGGDPENCNEKANKNEIWTEVLSSATQRFCQRHMAFSAPAVFRIMLHLIHSNPDIVKLALCHLQAEVRTVELRRGVGFDPVLRSCLKKIESSLETATKANKYNSIY